MSRTKIQKLVQQPVESIESHRLYQGCKLVDEASAEKLIYFVCCEDRLDRAMKASKMLALELELQEQKRSYMIMHGLVTKLYSELKSAKKTLKVAEEKCDMLQRGKDTLLESAKDSNVKLRYMLSILQDYGIAHSSSQLR